jgi:ribosomal protein L6P/L9E
VHLSGHASDGSTVEVEATQFYVKGPKGVLEITFSSSATDPKTDIRDAMIASLTLKS